ncbi:hypothetical protein HPB47_021504, partial [Ixodes persulcatus]
GGIVGSEDSNPTMQLEFMDLQYPPALKTMHRESELLEFYQDLDKKKYGNLLDHALRLSSLFGSTYACVDGRPAALAERKQLFVDSVRSFVRCKLSSGLASRRTAEKHYEPPKPILVPSRPRDGKGAVLAPPFRAYPNGPGWLVASQAVHRKVERRIDELSPRLSAQVSTVAAALKRNRCTEEDSIDTEQPEPPCSTALQASLRPDCPSTTCHPSSFHRTWSTAPTTKFRYTD